MKYTVQSAELHFDDWIIKVAFKNVNLNQLKNSSVQFHIEKCVSVCVCVGNALKILYRRGIHGKVVAAIAIQYLCIVFSENNKYLYLVGCVHFVKQIQYQTPQIQCIFLLETENNLKNLYAAVDNRLCAVCDVCVCACVKNEDAVSCNDELLYCITTIWPEINCAKCK